MVPEHIREAEIQDVLFERLNYLLDYHGPKFNHAYCMECVRLEVVRKQLLEVFETKDRREKAKEAKAA